MNRRAGGQAPPEAQTAKPKPKNRDAFTLKSSAPANCYARVTIADHQEIPAEFIGTYRSGREYEVTREEYRSLEAYKGLVAHEEKNPDWKAPKAKRGSKALLEERRKTVEEWLEELPEGYAEAEAKLRIIFAQSYQASGSYKEHVLNEAKRKTGIGKKALEVMRKEVERELEGKSEGEAPPPAILDKRFKDPHLFVHIRNELDKTHREDEKQKLALFIVGVSGFLKNHRDHVSTALKGDSSEGKDNLMDTVLKHLPRESAVKVTRSTQSMIEARINSLRVLALSELNKEREGANADLTELWKALAEGGGAIWKRDPITREEQEIKTDQKTIFFATTETYKDEELETRYVVIPISGSEEKNYIVVSDTLSKATRPPKEKEERESWIARSIRALKDLHVVIPYAEILCEPFKLEDGTQKRVFDLRKGRVKRDVKRLLSLTKAVAWLHQEQRIIKEIDGEECIIAEPCDFLTTLYLFETFFELTYSGMDHRLQQVLEAIHANQGQHAGEITALGFPVEYSDWVLRHHIQRELNIQTATTIKTRTDALRDLDLIETYYDPKIPRGYLLKLTEGVNQGINRVSEGISLIPLDTLLAPPKTENHTPTYPAESKIILPVTDEKSVLLRKKFFHLEGVLRPSNLRPSKPPGVKEKKTLLERIGEDEAQISDLLSEGYSEASIIKALELGDLFELRAGTVRRLGP